MNEDINFLLRINVCPLKQPERARGAAEPRCSRSSRSPEAGKCGWENPEKMVENENPQFHEKCLIFLMPMFQT